MIIGPFTVGIFSGSVHLVDNGQQEDINLDNHDRLGDDPVRIYLEEVTKLPPLTSNEEIHCINLLHAGGEEAPAAKIRLLETSLPLRVS
ncbi:MAG: sigma-70 factor domain-containing protein [Bryobacteraceae bacterium]